MSLSRCACWRKQGGQGVLHRVWTTSRFGAAMGGVYCLALTLFYGLSKGGNVQTSGFSFWKLIGWNLLSGVVAGGAIGLLNPLTRWLVGRMLVGTISVSLILLLYFYLPGRDQSNEHIVITILILSPVLGSILGAGTWIIDRGNKPTDDPSSWRLR